MRLVQSGCNTNTLEIFCLPFLPRSLEKTETNLKLLPWRCFFSFKVKGTYCSHGKQHFVQKSVYSMNQMEGK